MITNCAGIYDAEINVINDTLKLEPKIGRYEPDTNKNGKVSTRLVQYSCDCYYQFGFKIKGLTKLPKEVMVDSAVFKFYPDKYKTYPIKFSLKNKDTINLVDKYGLKQGHWYEEKENKGYFIGDYVNDILQSADSKEFYATGKLKFILKQTDAKNFESEDYFENGNPHLHIINHDTLGIVSTRFYEDGKIERLVVSAPGFDEEKLFYPNGHIKKITGNNIHQDYYPNGILKKEFSFINDNDISYRYYYPNGHLMATHYVKKEEKSKRESKKRRDATGKLVTIYYTSYWTEDAGETWTYFDKNCKAVNKQSLIDQGYSFQDE